MSEPPVITPKKKGILTKRNIAIIVVVLFVLVIWAGSGGSNTKKTATVEVQYTGKWQGALLNGISSSVSWSGDGNYVRTLDPPSSGPWIISVNAQKMESNSATLTLRIKGPDGKVLQEQSTTAAYGMVQISATIP